MQRRVDPHSLVGVTRRFLRWPESRFTVGVWAAFWTLAILLASGRPLFLLGFPLGVLLWGVSEYPVHRYLLHFPKPKSPALAKLHHRLHWGHHLEPAVESNLFIPLWSSAPIAAIAFALALWGTADAGLRWGVALGFWTGLTAYEWVHFSIHAPFRIASPFYRSLAKYHRWHHFRNERYWFGVTHPFMDKLLGTCPQPQQTQVSRYAGQAAQQSGEAEF